MKTVDTYKGYTVTVGDTVTIICDGREYHGIIRCVNKDDSVTIRDPRESYGHKVYNEDIVKIVIDTRGM